MNHPETEIAARVVELAVADKIRRVERTVDIVPESRKFSSAAERILDESRRIREAGLLVIGALLELDKRGGANSPCVP